MAAERSEMGLSITESYRSFNYGIQGKGRASKDKDDSFETMGSATSVTTSSDKGKNIGVANWVKSDENGKSYLDREMMDSKFFKYFGIQQVGMIANETIDSEFSTRIRIQNGQKNRGNIDTADLIRKTVSSKPDYMPYAGNHVVKNKNEYFAMAKDDMIVYQGVVFMCDRLTDTLTLGDVSDPNNCIRVGLSKGGSLLFNRNDAGSLMNAITMFSPEDQERIVKAIQIDNMAQKARKDVEDAKSGESVRSSDEAETDTDRNEESYEHI